MRWATVWEARYLYLLDFARAFGGNFERSSLERRYEYNLPPSFEGIKMEKVKPEKVKKYVCTVCGELLVKIFPYAAFGMTEGTVLKCKKCIAKGK